MYSFFYNWPLLHYCKGTTNPVSIFSVFVLAFCSVFFHSQHVSVALFVFDFGMCLWTGSSLKLWHFSRNGNVFALVTVDSCRFSRFMYLLQLQQTPFYLLCEMNTILPISRDKFHGHFSSSDKKKLPTWCIARVTRACQEFGSHITLMHA